MAPQNTLTFWYEFASPYSYLTASRIESLAVAAGVPVIWKPFLLGPIFARQGWNDSPFNLYPAKGVYLWRDMQRESTRFGIPWRQPSVLPRHSLLAARIALVLEEQGLTAPFSKAVFAANFVEDQDIADPAVLAGILETLGLPAAAVMEKAGSAKARLHQHTEAAIAAGIFGAPTFTLGQPPHHELFWGNDRLEQAIAWASHQSLAPDAVAGSLHD